MNMNSIMSMMGDYIIYALVGTLIIALLGALLIRLLSKKTGKGLGTISPWKILLMLALTAYVLVVLCITCLSRGASAYVHMTPRMSLFYSYREAWLTWTLRSWQYVILNIAMFVPWGFLLPLLSARFRKGWLTVGSGFLFSLLIETAQLVTGRGIFELDDLFNNTLGSLLGYSIVMLIQKLREKKVLTALLHLLPSACTAAVLAVMVIVYHGQEYGNLYLYNEAQNMKETEVVCGSELQLESDPAVYTVYHTKSFTKEESRVRAGQIFTVLGLNAAQMEETDYDDDMYYRIDDAGGSYSLFLNRKDGSFDYTNLTASTGGEIRAEQTTMAMARQILSQNGIELPENVSGEEIGEGKYTFTAKWIKEGDKMINGTVTCQIDNDLTLCSVSNHIIQWDCYGEEEMISQKEAFEKIGEGKASFGYYENFPEKLEFVKVTVIYQMDTKSYFRPVYEFSTEDGKTVYVR